MEESDLRCSVPGPSGGTTIRTIPRLLLLVALAIFTVPASAAALPAPVGASFDSPRVQVGDGDQSPLVQATPGNHSAWHEGGARAEGRTSALAIWGTGNVGYGGGGHSVDAPGVARAGFEDPLLGVWGGGAGAYLVPGDARAGFEDPLLGIWGTGNVGYTGGYVATGPKGNWAGTGALTVTVGDATFTVWGADGYAPPPTLP